MADGSWGNGGQRIGEVVGRGAHRAIVDTGRSAGHQAAAGLGDRECRAVEPNRDDPGGVMVVVLGYVSMMLTSSTQDKVDRTRRQAPSLADRTDC